MMTLTLPPHLSPQSPAAWPAEVDLIISALAAGENCEPAMPATVAGAVIGHRQRPRMSYRAAAELRLFSDAAGEGTWRLFTRDASSRGVGFITAQPLPLGHGGIIALPAPDGGTIEATCTLLRCREIAPGWFDGALCFNREQRVFAVR